MRKLILATLLLGSTLLANAQSGTNSPYSQYGLGVLSDQTSGFNRGMNGVGLGFSEHDQVNYLNPASYSKLDSMSFIFDAGISGQVTNFEENGVKKNANNSSFEYVVAGFRAAKHVGVSFGIVPFTNVGYDYTTSGYVDPETKNYTYTNNYSGSGGYHQVYVGAGWEPVKGFSFGANLSYLWGETNRLITSSAGTDTKVMTRGYTSDVHSYKLDLGVQYTHKIAKNDWLTVGLTYSPGHDLGDAELDMTSSATQTSQVFADTFKVANAYKLPDMFGAGLMWNHNNQWKVGFDYTLQKWGKLDYPTFENGVYAMHSGLYSDRSKYNVGLQYCYGERSRKFLNRVRYRIGASYATPYYKVNGADGPKEISVSAGFGIPIINSYNNRSFLNISGQWVKSSAKDLIKENYFRINIGFTFNENWFNKWKMD